MKKSEAATKWCPMYRIQIHMGEYTDNRAQFNPNRSDCCLTDDCACWVDENFETGHCGLAK